MLSLVSVASIIVNIPITQFARIYSVERTNSDKSEREQLVKSLSPFDLIMKSVIRAF